ncbi:cytochrome c family protein [Henriciella barbarensis]|uniref:Cytochrome c family protein n=1 Tax=Henriciella barbarensis TaxID=86342 RepID=A0A399R4D2_9PROT|nr:cytochrome c family protein [Henriciella barbarensis]RIJ24562.1 cytochrome c family protein [Henriciella barbarensis]
MKLRASMIAIVFAAGLSACGGGEEPAAPEASAPPVETGADAVETSEETVAEEAETASGPAEEGVQFAGFPEPYASADYATGKRLFMQCSSCHSLTEGGPTLLGPNLYGMFDRKVGEHEGFDYSQALQEADFEWTPGQLDQWLASPRNFLPGNRMSFAGVPREDQRAAIIAYVMSETGYTPQ